MIVAHNYNNFPEHITYKIGEIGELSDWEFKELEKLGVEEIWYWYACGSYEGIGQILMRSGNLYDIHDAGHCSCYGPTERADFKGVPFEELTDGFTKELLNEVKCLIDMANDQIQEKEIW
jgi:hypothetical protein